MRARKTIVRTGLCAVAVMMLGLSACASNGSTSGTTTGSTSGTKSTIVLGDVGEGTGPIGAAIADTKVAAIAWEDYTNAHGGLNGHPVKIIFDDDGGSPSQALTDTQKLIQQNHVVAFFGLYSAAGEPVIVPYLQQQGMPMIGGVGGSTLNSTTPMFFDPSSSQTVGAEHAAVETLQSVDKAAKKVAIIYCLESPACLQQETEIKATATAAGLDVVYTAQASLAAPDFTSQVLGARSAGAQAFLLVMDNPSSLRIIGDAKAQGWSPDFILNSTQYATNFTPGASVAGEKMYGYATTAPWSSAPAMQAYVAAVKQYEPGGLIGNNGAAVWAAGALLKEASASFGNTVTTKDILDAIYSLHGTTLGGLVPPITFPTSGPHNNVNTCVVPLQFDTAKNEWVAPLGPEHFVCADGSTYNGS
jgi:branched-chain amino acid transport system substrate-binding protein